jgi:hypothetical protein
MIGMRSFGHLERSEQDCARPFQARDNGGILFRHEVAVDHVPAAAGTSFIQNKSLIPRGTPCSGPRWRPAAQKTCKLNHFQIVQIHRTFPLHAIWPASTLATKRAAACPTSSGESS